MIEKSYTDEEIAAIAQKHKMPRYPKIALLREKLSRKAKEELMPSNAKNYGRTTLHVWGIPADSLSNEGIVLRLDFAPGVLGAM